MAKFNVVGATREALVAEHNRLNETYDLGAVPATAEDNYNELKTRVLKLQELAIAKNPAEGEGGNTRATSKAEPKLVVWLKTRAYVSDKERVDAGVYRLASLPERLSSLGAKYVEVFENTVPARKLVEMAKWAGIKHPEDYPEDTELLARLISPFTPFARPSRR